MEVRDGRPFVGASGYLLNEALKDAKLRREDVLICNVVNERPQGDEWDRHNAGAAARGFADLDRLLRQHPRAVVVTAGAQAFLTCVSGAPAPPRERDVAAAIERTFGGSVSELRGYIFDGAYGPVLCTVHPAFVLRQWLPWRATLSWDFRKAARRLLGPARRPTVSRYVTDASSAQRHVARLLSGAMLAVDSEEPPAACVAFAADEHEGVAFPLETCWEAVAELLASPTPKVLQNAQYDLTRFRRLGFTVGGAIHDTMLLWHAVEPLIAGKADSGSKQTQKSLRFLASVHTDEPWWKDYRFGSDEEKWALCATDARVTLEVFNRLMERLQ